MIWYLLYPLRGTTEPPQLSPTHPVRRAFQAHGTATARHWLLSILLTIVISVLLCYPALFQHDSPAAAGLRNLPKHVWTSTTEVEGERKADVQVRQVWVHGDYMKAIDHRVLREALHVQRVLIGNGFHEDAPLSMSHRDDSDLENCLATRDGEPWGFHSPLMYWNCSLLALDRDQDLLSTINSRTTFQSALNLTLRPSTVFAGKVFAKSRLRSADALVITLLDYSSAGLGAKWDDRSRRLVHELPPEWSLFPEDGQITKSRLYEFRFKPMTLNDDILLAASYIIMAVYVIWRMMQLRAVKSWFGLLVTICAKMTICVVGSFTVCTFLGIDLARIPRPWFPAVVFCYGLGNIFRLISVVLETPPEMPPQQRIGHAIGQVGHLSVAVAGQNLILIWLCSRVVTPWVADFCVFAAVTLVLDLVYHLTFFLAVLSVDVQRMELSDSLQRVDMKHASQNNRHERQSWLHALRHGTLPFSTRFAGTAAILTIILAINWHFFDSNTDSLSLKAVKDNLFRRQSKRLRTASPWTQPPINQARTPADWLRLQDHNTAKELFSFIKPNAHSFIAKIHDPLLVILKGANGRYSSPTPPSFIDGLRTFARHHAFPAALIVVFLIAGVTLLMNYLLWTGLPEGAEESEDEDSMFTVSTLSTTQTLDIIRVTSSPKGHIVGVSLDRTTSLWLHDKSGFSQSILNTKMTKYKLWPLVACALDDSGDVLAMCTDNGIVGLYSLAASRVSCLQHVDLRGQIPLMFTFVLTSGEAHESPSLLILTSDGYLTEFEARAGVHHTRRIHSGTIVCSALYSSSSDGVSLVFVSKQGEVHILSLDEDSRKTPEMVAGLDPGPPPGTNPSKIRCIESVPALGLIFALRDEEVEVFDFSRRALVHAFHVRHIKPHSFRVMYSTRRKCGCSAPAVHCISIAYTEEDTENMLMHVFTIDDTPTSSICLGKPADTESRSCQGLAFANEAIHLVEPAGTWEATSSLSVVGIRKYNPSPTPSSTASGSETTTPDPAVLVSALKQRAMKVDAFDKSAQSPSSSIHTHHLHSSLLDTEGWEAWTLSSTGEFRSRPLISDCDDGDQPMLEEQLFVAAAGPITKLGKRSVAVGFGNTIKIITLGKENFGALAGTLAGADDWSMAKHKSRTKRTPGRKLQ
ncbi:unnamed protein product [Periconia digitata]|uniref:SSD domain-containing protein n=1 Tax=Periconia digitata TaxID=1303443 RepID=A0A9W4U4Z7_9PLEO|nr:unnamed protein product [Periconia digitata]